MSADSLLQKLLVAPSVVLRSRPARADDEACPKCRFAGGVDGLGWARPLWVSPEESARHNVRDEKGNLLGECLMVSCARCGYKWHEPVAVKEENSKPS